MNRIHLIGLATIVGCLAACIEAPTHHYGAFPPEAFVVHSENVGVYPYDDVLVDPNNPVARSPIGDCPDVPLGETPRQPCTETKWQVESQTDSIGSPILSFYIWATWLVREPTGEHQFYAAENLRKIYENGLAAQGDLSKVRLMAVAGYQSLLDNFLDSVSYDDTGQYAYPLAPLAFDAMQALDATPSGYRLEGEQVVKQ